MARRFQGRYILVVLVIGSVILSSPVAFASPSSAQKAKVTVLWR